MHFLTGNNLKTSLGKKYILKYTTYTYTYQLLTVISVTNRYVFLFVLFTKKYRYLYYVYF